MGLSHLEGSDLTPLPLGFTEYKDSGDEDFNWKEGKADLVRVFDGIWDRRHEFIFNHILPRATSANGETVFSSPAVYPEYHFARAYRATVKGLGTTNLGDTGLIKHRTARITVYYSTPEFQNDSNGGNNRPPGSADPLYAEETVDTETEILPITARKFEACYHGGGEGGAPCRPFSPGDGGYDTEEEFLESVGSTVRKKLTELGKVPYRINRFNYKLKLPYVIFPRWGDIDFCLGRVNYIPFITPSGLFAAPETLRYDGLTSITKRELSIGTLVWEIEHKFCYYKPGWNTIPDCDEDTGKIINFYLKPPLYGSAIHQRIFIPFPSNLAARIYRAWQRQSPSTLGKVYNPTRENTLTQEDIKTEFLNDNDLQDSNIFNEGSSF